MVAAMVPEILVADPIAQNILAAARKRFEQYGFGKTTMAEIAADCGMSAANIYRYFENKQDIGARLATHCMSEEEAALAQVVARSELSAGARLEMFLLETLRYGHRRWSEQPRINELVEVIAKERPDVVYRHSNAKHAMLMRLIEDGNASGEFAVEDVGAVAWAFLHATVLFDVPLFFHLHSLGEFEKMAKRVSDLLLRGLAKR
jgi:AcrR family transcriptional regulator